MCLSGHSVSVGDYVLAFPIFDAPAWVPGMLHRHTWVTTSLRTTQPPATYPRNLSSSCSAMAETWARGWFSVLMQVRAFYASSNRDGWINLINTTTGHREHDRLVSPWVILYIWAIMSNLNCSTLNFTDRASTRRHPIHLSGRSVFFL